MIKSQIMFVTAILAGKSISQKHVKTGKCRMGRRFYIGFEANDAGQLKVDAGAGNCSLIFADGIDAIEKNSFDRILP